MKNVLILSPKLDSPRVKMFTRYFEERKASITSLRLSSLLHQPLLWLSSLESLYWSEPCVRNLLKRLHYRPKFDIAVACGITTLPLALSKARFVISDLEEFAFEGASLFKKAYLRALLERYLPLADLISTPTATLQEDYARRFHVNAEILPSYAPYRSIQPKPTDDEAIKLIYHAVGSPSSHVELLLDIFSRLNPRFSLDISLTAGNSAYIKEMKRQGEALPRIRFVTNPEFSDYDLGLLPLLPSSLENQFGLPSILFSLIQARLGIVASPLVEVERLLKRHSLGAVASDFTAASFAECLMKLDKETIDRYKQASHEAAPLFREEIKIKVGTLLPCRS